MIAKKTMVAALAALVLAAGAKAGEEKIPLDKLPKPVLEAVKKRFPKATLVEAAKETDGDKVEFEVTIKDGESKIDVMLSPEGKITLIEKGLPVTDMPKPLAEMLAAKYPNATYTVFEEVTKVTDGKETFDFYEVILTTAGKKTLELKIAVEVKIAATEEKIEEKK